MATPNSHNANVIFIDTNLNTHFALTVSDHDSVSDLKKRIESEHLSCFPNFGQIQIHGIKVKRNGHFYHLSDSMIVRSAFSGFNKSWFLSVDVSALEDCRQNEKLFSHGSLHQIDSIGIANNALVGSGDNDNNNAIILPCNYQLQLLENKKDEREGVSAKEAEAGVKSSGNNDLRTPLPGSIHKTDDRSHLNNGVQSLRVESEVGGLGKGNKDDCNVDVEESSISVRSEKRKRKSKRKREDTVDVGGDKSKEEIPSDRPLVSEHIEKEAVKNLENKKGEREGVSVVRPCVSEHTAKEAEGGVKSSGNNDVTTPLPGSIPKTDDRSHLNNEVDGHRKGNKDDCNVGVGESSMSVQSEKKKRKSKRKREDTVDVGDDNSKEEIASDSLRVLEHIEKEAVKNLETVPSLNIQCRVEGSAEENKEVPSTSVPSAKRRKKSKKEKEGTVGGDKSKEEIPSDHPRVSEHTEKEATKISEVVPNLSIECEVDGSGERNKDEGNVGEEVLLVSVPSTKTKKKSKKKKDTVGGDNSKDNIVAVNKLVDCPSERASSFNNFQVPQSENKQDEKEEIPFDGPCDSHNTKKEAVKNLEMVPNSHIECEVDGSNKGSKNDSIVCEEGTSKSAPSSKNKQKIKSKSKRKKEDTVGGDISKDNIASVDNPLGYPSEKASTINNFQVSQSENKQDEKEIHFDLPRVPEHTEKSVKNLEMVPNSHIECEVDGSNKGIKGDSIVCDKETSKPTPSAKKKHKSKRKKEDAAQDDTLKDDTLKEKDVSVVVPVQHDIVLLANSSENADKEIIKETDVLKEHHNTKSNNNNTKNDGNVVSLKEASELKSPVKKKPKKSKRSLKVETASQKDQAQTADEAHKERKESEDIVLSKTNLDKMEIETDAGKESTQLTTKEAGNYKNQSDIELEVQPSDANEPKDLMEDNENVVVGHCHESEVGQIEGAAEGEVPPQNDDVNGMKEPVKPVKEKKEITKVQNNGGGQTPKKDNGLVDALESETVVAKSLKGPVCDPMPENTETQENPLNQMEGKVMQQVEMQGSGLSVTDEGGVFSTDNADSLDQPKTKSNAENVDEHVSKTLKKKPNNKQSSSPKGTSNMLTNGHVFDSKKECDAHKIDKAPIAHKTGQVAKLSSLSGSAMSSIGENRKPRGNASVKSMDLEKQREHIPISNRKLEGSNKMVQNKARKASGNYVTGVVSNSQLKKSLLEGAIFKDDGSSASEDENKDDDSDASTRTPSDNSLVSDFDGYDSPGLDSQQNGTYNGKRLENDERSPLKASLSGPTKMSIDLVVRSSTRYKRAKLTASQLDETQPQLDETQPPPESPGSPEFVPDSLPVM